MKLFIIILLTLHFLSCGSKKAKNLESIPLQINGLFTMDLLQGSKLIDLKGIDSYIGLIVIPTLNDTLKIEIGKTGIIADLYDKENMVVDVKEKDNFIKNLGYIPDGVSFSLIPEVDKQQNTFDRHYYLYDSTNGILKKLILPKIIGNGQTGVYVLNFKDSTSFSIYADNVDSTTNKILVDAFKSIKKIN